MKSNLSLGHFVTMASLKTLFDLSLGIKFLTSVKLNPIQSRGTVYISGYFGLVILVINLLIRSLLMYISAIFLPTCVWFSARGFFLTSGRKDVLLTPKIVVLWFILFYVFAVHNALKEPINVWIQELNTMYP